MAASGSRPTSSSGASRAPSLDGWYRRSHVEGSSDTSARTSVAAAPDVTGDRAALLQRVVVPPRRRRPRRVAGPGKPVTVVDTGIDFAHPEFRGRPETVALNTITFNDKDRGSHGTAVGSLVAAPVNGVGLVGIYPRARLLVW